MWIFLSVLSCQELTVWAYPTRVEHVEDSVVCSIRDNPELVLVNLSCWGVRPELELETRHLHFDRVLLHRYQTYGILIQKRQNSECSSTNNY